MMGSRISSPYAARTRFTGRSVMKSIGILVVCGALLSSLTGVASAAQSTYVDCNSAFNDGQNQALFYVSASTSRTGCSGLDHAEAALAKVMRKYKIHPNNTDALKVCFYEGLY